MTDIRFFGNLCQCSIPIRDLNKARDIFGGMSNKTRLRYDMAIKYSFDYIYKGSNALRRMRGKRSGCINNADIMFDSIWMVQTSTRRSTQKLLNL